MNWHSVSWIYYHEEELNETQKHNCEKTANMYYWSKKLFILFQKPGCVVKTSIKCDYYYY